MPLRLKTLLRREREDSFLVALFVEDTTICNITFRQQSHSDLRKGEYLGAFVTRDIDVQPVIMAMKKSIPARFPKKETTQFLARSRMVIRRLQKATVMNWDTVKRGLNIGGD